MSAAAGHAVLTGPGRGGVAVVACFGTGSEECVASVQDRLAPAVGRTGLRSIRGQDDEFLGEVLVHHGSAPGGWWEIQCTGSPALVSAVGAALERAGAPRQAPPLAAGDPGDSWSPAAAAMALHGAVSPLLVRVLLGRMRGSVASALEDLDGLPDRESFQKRVDEWCATAAWGARLGAVHQVVLTGAANAGKSTLFNLVLGRRRSVVSSQPGTTRDALSEEVVLGAGWLVRLTDTAGSRVPGDELDAAGQAVGRRRAASADLVVDVADVRTGPRTVPAGVLRVVTHMESSDGVHPTDAVAVSAMDDPGGSVARLEAALLGALGLPADPMLDPPPLLDSAEADRLRESARWCGPSATG